MSIQLSEVYDDFQDFIYELNEDIKKMHFKDNKYKQSVIAIVSGNAILSEISEAVERINVISSYSGSSTETIRNEIGKYLLDSFNNIVENYYKSI